MATDPQTLLAQSNCYACFGIAGTWRILEVSLLAQWAAQSAVIPIQAETTAWVARVQANGGGTPSANSQTAVNNFVFALKQAGIFTKMIHVNCIAPDNYITATTPLLVGTGGFNQWQDPSTLLANEQINLAQGLNGDQNYTPGAFFDTGVIPRNTALAVTNGGISVYVSVQEPDGTNHCHGGCDDVANGGTNHFKLIYDFEFLAYDNSSNNGYVYSVGGGVYAPFAGFFSLNVEPNTPGWHIGAYGNTNGVVQWGSYTNLPNESGGGTPGFGLPPQFRTFGWFDCNGNFQEPSAETMSFAAFHQGLTFAQSNALFNAVQAMRIKFGSGYI